MQREFSFVKMPQERQPLPQEKQFLSEQPDLVPANSGFSALRK